jgi:hypothetical protein
MRSTKTTVRKRVEELLALRLVGAEFVNLRHHAAEAGWGVSDRQLFRYIAAGDDLLAKTQERDRAKLFNRFVAVLWVIVARCLAASNDDGATRAIRVLLEMHGQFPPKRIAPVMPDGRTAWQPVLSAASAEDLAQLARLQQRLRPVADGQGG